MCGARVVSPSKADNTSIDLRKSFGKEMNRKIADLGRRSRGGRVGHDG